MSSDELTAALDDSVERAFEREQVPFLASLVDAPSYTYEPADVERAAAILDGMAQSLGLIVERHPEPSGTVADHRVYHPEGLRPDAPALGLVGHVDTVFPRALGFLGFERVGNDAGGPGVLDMKSGLSSIFFALRALREVDRTSYERLAFRVIVNSDEEIGSVYSARLLGTLAPHLTAALVFEAGRAEDAIVIARKGVGRFEIGVKGRAAHSGLSHADGVNAIAALAHRVVQLHGLTDYDRAVTVNVGMIAGGTSANTVPADARCSVDLRFVEPEVGPKVAAAIRAAAVPDTLPGSLGRTQFTIEGGINRPPLLATDASRALMADYGTHARAVGLGFAEAPLQGGGSDANILGAHGLAVIDGLGPRGTGIHRQDERCELDSLAMRTRALARFLAEQTR